MHYGGVDAQTAEALGMGRDELLAHLGDRVQVFDDNDAMVSLLADTILDVFEEALAAGRERAAMIVPVGPVGQYPLVAARGMQRGLPMDRLSLFVMDEYLNDDGSWIDESDPLSFRAHIRKHLIRNLPEHSQPEVIIPRPDDPSEVGRRIGELGGLDASFAGVGITGHLAFNEPIAGVNDADYFADLPTRVVPLLAETRLINSVTAARGNVARIPRMAVTVGMREILSARRIRIFMNRNWQSAAIRRLACGPRSADFPASLVQGHPDWRLYVVGHVLDPAEPELA